MAKDFTVDKLETLFKNFIDCGYNITSFEEYIKEPKENMLILRHDVDRLPLNSLATAKMEHKLGVKGSYYFRVTPGSFQPQIIEEIVQLGHEIGYHYEDLTIVKGNSEKAVDHFKNWLEKFRTFYPVKTICMHGSPMTKWDNKDLWKEYDYKEFGLIGEPYFDVDFDKMLYITDTGRRWDGDKVSVRDKVKSKLSHNFKKTDDIIKSLKKNQISGPVMLTLHPQRWSNNSLIWWTELITQNLKNIVKRLIVQFR